MRDHLLTWQWSLYPDGHTDRRNLLIHIVTVPLFEAGFLTLLFAVFNPWLALGGGAAMIAALVLQGRGHRLEPVRPVPFDGPLDFVTRFFAEQCLTFPRFVLSGAFAKAWRRAPR